MQDRRATGAETMTREKALTELDAVRRELARTQEILVRTQVRLAIARAWIDSGLAPGVRVEIGVRL